MRFKEISEERIGKRYHHFFKHNEDLDKFVDHLNKYCSNSIWMFEKNKPIWRGMKDYGTGPIYYNTLNSKRKSENTDNYYTEIFDNHPQMKDFPKRSKSIICDTGYNNAFDYGSNVYAVIPENTAKIGYTNKYDMWAVRCKFLSTNSLEDVARTFHRLNKGIKDNISSIKKYATIFDKLTDKQLLNIINKVDWDYNGLTFNMLKQARNMGLMNYIWNAFSPKITKLSWSHPTPNGFLSDGEVWVEGKVILISRDQWNKLRAEYEAS